MSKWKLNPFNGKGFEYFIDEYKFEWWAWPLSFLLSFHLFYFPKHPYEWRQKKRVTLNHFKGYSWFGLHYDAPSTHTFLDGSTLNTKEHMYVGFTAFYLRIEFHFNWNHKGPYWYKFREWW